MIAVIDYGVGNLFSLTASLKYLGADVKVTGEKEEIEAADRIILPGVGAFADAKEKLDQTGLVETILEQTTDGKPLLGICLGMQLLFDESHEYGVHKGLGLIKGKIASIDEDLKKAGIGDYVVISMGEESKTALEDVLQGNDDIKECRIEPVIWGDKSNLKKADGTKIEAKNSVVFQALEDSQLKYFDKDNKQITEIQPGHAYVTGDFMEENDLKTGDKITVTYDSIFFSVTLDGDRYRH